MTIEEPEPNPTSDHMLDWLEDSLSFFPTFLDDPECYSDDINTYSLWDQSQDFIIDNTQPTGPFISSPPPTSDSSNKRKSSNDLIGEASQNDHERNSDYNPQATEEEEEDEAVKVYRILPVNKKSKAKANKATGGSVNSEGRWAEQLLNPCAAAIATGNLTRVQHLLFVLHELASATGDANYRLAAHGVRALTRQLSPHSASSGSTYFASAEPRFFQRSLLEFYEVSPWFAFPNNLANASILQIFDKEEKLNSSRNLHILDIGVSHGVQWPTLLEALARRSGGPPRLVRLTVVSAATSKDEETPFSMGPPGDNYSSRLLGFVKTLNMNLQINIIQNKPLQSLNAQTIEPSPDENLIICAQFRLHQLSHQSPDERTEFLKVIRRLEPKGVILSENDMECSCSNCGDFAVGFSRRVDFLWKFLDSSSSAFKGKESDERRLIEREAAKALTSPAESNERMEKWWERMRMCGFVGEGFGEDAIDGARALLRKYDSNWEMRIEEKEGCVSLWWKGLPVSFSSLWKLNMAVNDS